ncbi:hypothetical protein FANTH_4025 [Fusarium anthophilum]|uniref:Uncharacterized protein n=1 Tax=Fusarium anthophilum TaxID=48485 RepID=A0A8H5E8A5_9HYPO|nr:hypothetical protein FANTH_4025 [Fusarium anthophilum]
MTKLVADFSKLYQEKQERKFLDAAMGLARGAVTLTGGLICTKALIDLLATQFQISREKKYTNEAIERARHAIKLKLDSGGDQSVSCMEMGDHLHEKYNETRQTEYLDAATDLTRQAAEMAARKLEWTTYWSQEQSIYPTKLISRLADQYQVTKDKKYIEEAIESARQFTNLMKKNDRGLLEFMRNMIKCFQEQYKKTEETKFQDEAVIMESEATDRASRHKQLCNERYMRSMRLLVWYHGATKDRKHLDEVAQVAIENQVALSLERLKVCEPGRSSHNTTVASELFEESKLTEDSASFSGESLAVHTGGDTRRRRCFPGKVLHLQEATDREEWIRASIDVGHRNADSAEQLREFIKSFPM